jgi:hypothetical protein
LLRCSKNVTVDPRNPTAGPMYNWLKPTCGNANISQRNFEKRIPNKILQRSNYPKYTFTSKRRAPFRGNFSQETTF